MAKDGVVKAIAMAGSDAFGVVGGTFVEFDAPALNNRDEVPLSPSSGEGGKRSRHSIFSATGDCANCWPEGDPFISGGHFSKFGLPAINNRGVVAFPVSLDHGPALGGIFVTGTRDLKMLAGAGALVPDGQMIVRFSERVAIDDDDNIAFAAQLGNGRAATEAVMKVSTSGLTMIAQAGDPAPGGGKFSGFGPWPGIGSTGRIAFVAAVDDGPGPIGIFTWLAGSLDRVVMAGQKVAEGGVLPPFALNAVTSVGANGGVTFASMTDTEAGAGRRIYYYGPPVR